MGTGTEWGFEGCLEEGYGGDEGDSRERTDCYGAGE